ncbi:MAG: hypothetical protein VKI81_04030 [Synechococcaceae cyanobacterium]|nr:hypothetical protein [Synechococcaceae cyanobacterium]
MTVAVRALLPALLALAAGPLRAQAPAPAAVSPAPLPTGAQPPLPPLTPEEFEAILASGDRARLREGCLRVEQEGGGERQRRLQERLVALHPPPRSFEEVMADAEALLDCRAPEASLKVLDRYGPGPGPRRDRWLRLQWRAATAALDHRRAALALERLTGGRPERLEAEKVILQQREDGTVVTRPALDLLAGHLESIGLPREAAEVLLAAPLPGVAGADRLQLAARLRMDLTDEERDALLEQALEQAAEAGAWGLVTELLDRQLELPAAPPDLHERALERRLRLSERLDDAYGEWILRRRDPADAGRADDLGRRLRSPRDPGGHAPPPPPGQEAPPVAEEAQQPAGEASP